jgi:glycosyltransferase involved in cell wall biosynthesis
VKRILIFSIAYHPRVGGAEVALKEITSRIDDIEFHIVTLRFDQLPAHERMENIEVHRVGSGSYFSKILFAFTAARLGAALHRERHFDGAWAMMSYMVLPLVVMRLWGVRLPYVLTLQEGDTYDYMFGRWRVLPVLPLITWGFRRATVVHAISAFLGAWARRRGFAGPLEIIPNGVDVKHFAGEKAPHKGVTLITASRLVHKNGLDTVITALVHMPGVRFKILGVGPGESALRALAADAGVTDRVDFLGYVNHANLPQHLRGADIFIRPSRSEGMGNSFIEAMAAGLPVIATQEGGIADFLFDAKRNPDKPATGWAVDKDTPEQIVRAVEEILGNPERTRTVVETARAMVFEKYDWDLIARAMREKVFARVLPRSAE